MKLIYREVYQAFYRSSAATRDSRVLEIGSAGLNFAREFWPAVLTTSFDTNGGIFAEDLPFEENSFDVIIAKDVLHHIKDVPKAFAEFYRVLDSGGKVVVSEPSWSLLGRFIFKYLHEEVWQESQNFIIESEDPWASNQALIYNLTKISRSEQLSVLNGLEMDIHGCTYSITYLISGGVHSAFPLSHRLLAFVHSLRISGRFRNRFVNYFSLNRIVTFTKRVN